MKKLTGVAALGAVSVLAAMTTAADSTKAVSRTSYNLLGEGVGLVAYDPVSYFPEGGSKPEKGLDTRAKFLESSDVMLAKAGTRQEVHNRRLHDFIRGLPESCLLTSVCTGSWIYGEMGLLDGVPATNRKEPDRVDRIRIPKRATPVGAAQPRV